MQHAKASQHRDCLDTLYVLPRSMQGMSDNRQRIKTCNHTEHATYRGLVQKYQMQYVSGAVLEARVLPHDALLVDPERAGT
jgi:hypothetical protein